MKVVQHRSVILLNIKH